MPEADRMNVGGNMRTRKKLIIHKSPSFINRKALHVLDVAVVGGGIAGLACAYAFAKAGHRVRVLERSTGNEGLSGGIRVPPNLTKILVEWGLEDKLAEAAQKCRSSTLYSMETGEVIGYHEWKDDVLEETGADFLSMHHEDLHSMLLTLSVSAGVCVSYACTVTSVTPPVVSSQRVRVGSLSHGILEFDIVVGADGAESVVRPVVCNEPEQEQEQDVESEMSVFTITIPSDVLREHEDPMMAKLPDQLEWPIWMGTSRGVIGYPIRDGNAFALHCFLLDQDTRKAGTTQDCQEWGVKCSADCLKLKDCERRLEGLLKMAPYALRTRYVKRAHAKEWVDASGRVVLIGEAAHPLMPCSMHNCSLAVEDGAVLGALFSRLHSTDQIRPLMEAYQDLRQARCLAAHEAEVANAEAMWLPPGPERDARDAAMRRDRERQWDEGKLREQWDQVGRMFGYCADDEADDWWVRWGVLRDSSHAMRPFEPLDLKLEVTRVMEVLGE